MRRLFTCCSLLALAGLVLTGCRTLQPQMPAESYPFVPVKPQTSVVNLHVDLETARLENIVNNQTDSILYEDNSFLDKGGDNLMLKAWKNGRIRVSCEENRLSWEIPLRVNMKKGVSLFALNIPFADIMDANGEINLRFVTKLTVNRDWSIKTETTTDGYDWVKKPSVKVAGISVPVKAMVDLLLYANLDGYAKEIDKTIASSFDLRTYAEKGWQMMFNPFKLPGGYQAWLAMTPYSVSLLPVKGNKGFIRFQLAVATDVECLLDKKPSSGKVSALPSLQPLEMPDDTFRINLLTDIPFPTIERLTMEEVRDSLYTFGSRKLRFESFRIYGSNQQLVIETNVKGSINGTLFLTGTPVFHAADTTLRVQNLKFDLKTRNLMMKSAKWLFNGKIERSLTEAIAIPFNSNVLGIEKELSAFLNHYQLGWGFELNGKLARLTVSELILTPGSVKANLVFLGNLSIGIGETGGKK